METYGYWAGFLGNKGLPCNLFFYPAFTIEAIGALKNYKH